LYGILFTNAHGMGFQMKMTQPYTQFCSSLYKSGKSLNVKPDPTVIGPAFPYQQN
jgi:hypothetical protein